MNNGDSPAWVKSSYSMGNGACVEVGASGQVYVRDTKQEHLGSARTILAYSPDAWREFTGLVKTEHHTLVDGHGSEPRE